MLADLDRVPWATLRYGYGDASDMPDLLRRLAADGNDEDALAGVYRRLLDGGMVTEVAPHAVPFLVELLDAEDPTPEHVLQILAVVGERCLPPQDAATLTALAEGFPVYARLVTDGDEPIRLAAARVLGSCAVGAAALVPLLRERMANEPSARVRASFLMAAGEPVAAEWLSDPEPMVRAAAALLLTRRGRIEEAILANDLPFAVDDLGDLPWVQLAGGPFKAVISVLDGQPDAQIRLLTTWLRHDDPEVRADAAWVVGHLLGDLLPAVEALPLLVECLNDESDEVRRWAAAYLSELGEAARPAADALWTVVREEPFVHFTAATLSLKALAVLHDARAAAFLAERLDDDPTPWAALHPLLRRIGPWAPQCRQPLLRHLADPPPGEIGDAIIAAIGSYGPDTAVVRALRAQLSTHPKAASRVLGDFGPVAVDAVDDLAPLVDHDDPVVRVDAARAIWRITGDAGPALATIRSQLVEPGRARVEAIEVLAEMGPPGAEFAELLPPLFASTGVVLVARAGIAYWRLTGDAEAAVPALVSTLRPRSFGAPTDVGLAVLDCLAEIGPAAAQAVPVLEEEIAKEMRFGGRVNSTWQNACQRALDSITGRRG